MKKLSEILLDTKTEEDVKARYAEFFKIKYNTADKHDLYHDEVLFEFKYDVNLSSLHGKAKVLAQILYYIFRLKFKQSGEYAEKRIPPFLCLADKNETVLTETAIWKKYYSGNYDWDLQPSSPDSKLVEDLKKDENFLKLATFDLQKSFDEMNFCEALEKALDKQKPLDFGEDKKIISEENFEEVFLYWDSIFHNDVQNGVKSSRYFVCDISAGKSEYSDMKGGVNFYLDEKGKTVFKTILKKNYEKFWNIYAKIDNPRTIEGILAKIDRLTDDSLRRFEGQFFTPLDFAKKGLEYLEKNLGKDFYKKYKIWDMCAGTGNLEYYIPSEFYHNVYVSTLAEDEVEHLKKVFWTIPENVFQYNYLNDDVDLLFAESEQQEILQQMGNWKLPKNLREDLKNPENKWIILINPPYATSQIAGTNMGESKKDVSHTKIREKMHEQNLGEVSRELFSQFLFRIEKEFRGKNAVLAMYSTLKYINANNDEKLREKIFDFSYKNGFIFNSLNFTGNKGSFPVGFLIWDIAKRQPLEQQNIVVDVFESTIRKKEMIRGSAIKIGQKKFIAENKEKFLSKWVKRPSCIKNFPAMKSAINVAYDNKDIRDRISENFIGSLKAQGNDIQNQNLTAFFSGPSASAGAFSIEPENFVQSLVVNAVRRIPKATWINDRDQFMQPKNLLSAEFSNDCVVWSLFSGSNQSSSLKNVKYKNQIFQIHNQFFPFASAKVLEWKISNPDIKAQIAKENRFVADFLRSAELSAESKAVLEIGQKIYQAFFEKWNELDRTKFKLETWDAGWWQIRMSLADQNFCVELFAEMKKAHEILKKKLLPQIYEFGFLAEEKVENAE